MKYTSRPQALALVLAGTLLGALLIGPTACTKDTSQEPQTDKPADDRSAGKVVKAPADGDKGTKDEAGEDDGDLSVRGHKPSEFPKVSEPPRVVVIDAGTGEKRALRYRLEKGSKHTLAMTMYMAMRMKLGAMDAPKIEMPGMKMVADARITEAADGRFRYEFLYDSEPEILPTPGANAQVVSQLRTQLAMMKGMHGFAVVTERGFTLEGDIQLAKGAAPQVEQMLGSMRQSLQQIAAPLPEEPVGKGARWKVLYHLDMNGMELYQVGEFSLVDIDGDQLTLDLEMWQRAPRQMMNPPGMPPGTKAEIERVESSGKGSMKLTLTQLTPESELRMESAMSMNIEAGGQKQAMAMDMSLRMLVDDE